MKRKLSLTAIDFRINRLSNEIIKLTDQQAKHRDKVTQGCTDKYIKRFISVVGKMIVDADRQLQILTKQREDLLNERHK